MKTFELIVDDNCRLIADFKKIDASFYHEFGFERRTEYEMLNFQIYVTVDGIEHDMTKFFKQDENLRHYKRLEKLLLDKFEGDLSIAS